MSHAQVCNLCKVWCETSREKVNEVLVVAQSRLSLFTTKPFYSASATVPNIADVICILSQKPSMEQGQVYLH